MRALILIGAYDDPKEGRVVDNLYTGLSGVDLEVAAEKAVASKKYTEIGRLTNPSFAPMAIDPRKTVCSKPTFPGKTKPVEVKLSEKNALDRQHDAERVTREARFKKVTA